MPLWKCTGCQHEWEGSIETNDCDWCDHMGKTILNLTQLEYMDLEGTFNRIMRDGRIEEGEQFDIFTVSDNPTNKMTAEQLREAGRVIDEEEENENK